MKPRTLLGDQPRPLSRPAAAPRIRLATPGDAPLLAELRLELRTTLAPEVEPEAGFRERCSAWMASRLAEPGPWYCWLAEEAERGLLGTVWVQILEKLPNPVHEPERHAYVTGLYVRPAARNLGLGSALLEAALALCSERGTDTVFLWPTPRSRPLYARHGFMERAGVLERQLWSHP